MIVAIVGQGRCPSKVQNGSTWFGFSRELTLEEWRENFPSSGARKQRDREPDLGFSLGNKENYPVLPVENLVARYAAKG